MTEDHYSVLGISQTADFNEIRRAYKVQARKWHPDRNVDNIQEANTRFQAIAAAFEVLGDSSKKSTYDSALRNTKTTRTTTNTSSSSSSSSTEFASGRSAFYDFGQYYNSTFGSGFPHAPPRPERRPYARRSTHRHQHTSQNSFFDSYFDPTSNRKDTNDSNDSYSYERSHPPPPPPPQPAHANLRPTPPVSIPKFVKRKLAVSLEDIYSGTTKRLKVKRQGHQGVDAEKIVDVVIKPGCGAGTEILIPNEGDIMANGIRQDIQCVLDEKPHDVYTRDGDDLHITVKLDLSDALIGFTKEILALDNTKVPLTSDAVIQPGQKVRLNRRGMPNPETGRRGDLFVTYNVALPTSLSTSQKIKIMEALG